MVKWTFDIESNWGGRGDTYFACDDVLPRLLALLDTYGVKATFFLSGGISYNINLLIEKHGHEIGSHGFYHTVFPTREQNKENVLDGLIKSGCERWRAPKFCYENIIEPYSMKKNHVGILKYMRFGGHITEDTIFYAHPFDFYEWKGKLLPPSLFCRLWYSQPKRAWRTFENLLRKSS